MCVRMWNMNQIRFSPFIINEYMRKCHRTVLVRQESIRPCKRAHGRTVIGDVFSSLLDKYFYPRLHESSAAFSWMSKRPEVLSWQVFRLDYVEKRRGRELSSNTHQSISIDRVMCGGELSCTYQRAGHLVSPALTMRVNHG